jgi:hypothetical protein
VIYLREFLRELREFPREYGAWLLWRLEAIAVSQRDRDLRRVYPVLDSLRDLRGGAG